MRHRELRVRDGRSVSRNWPTVQEVSNMPPAYGCVPASFRHQLFSAFTTGVVATLLTPKELLPEMLLLRMSIVDGSKFKARASYRCSPGVGESSRDVISLEGERPPRGLIKNARRPSVLNGTGTIQATIR